MPYRIVEWGALRWLYHALHPALAMGRVIAAQPRPILVYQMSKVGSTSVCAALRDAGLRPLHVHFLGPMWEECRKAYGESGAPPPIHLSVERLLRPYLRFTSHRLKVVTLTRDPIGRYVSSAFQTARRDGYDTEDVGGTVERLRGEILQGRGIDYCADWFDRELRAVFGVDVLAYDFDRQGGHSVVEGSRVDVLTLKLETLHDNWHTLSEFVRRPVESARTKQRLALKGADSYRKVRDQLSLPREAVEDYYDHPWMRHFYTEGEIVAFCDRWSV